MANVKLVFSGTEDTEDHELQAYINTRNEIYISIDIEGIQTSWICLDKSTAIKFAKTLRTEINKMEDYARQ